MCCFNWETMRRRDLCVWRKRHDCHRSCHLEHSEPLKYALNFNVLLNILATFAPKDASVKWAERTFGIFIAARSIFSPHCNRIRKRNYFFKWDVSLVGMPRVVHLIKYASVAMSDLRFIYSRSFFSKHINIFRMFKEERSNDN